MHVKYNQEQLRLWKTYDLNIPYAGFALLGSDWAAHKSISPFSRLYYITNGAGSIQTQHGDIPLEKDHVYLLPAGLPYGYHCENYMEQLFFHINLTHINGIDLFRGFDRIYSRKLSVAEIESVKKLYFSENIADTFFLKGLLFQELSRFLQMAGIGESHIKQYSPLITQAFFLAQNPVNAGRHTSDLAKLLHVSPSTLTKRFRAETGMTTGEYLTQIVISQSCNLLLADDKPISDIAHKLGFADQFYFAKHFKKHMHVSPSTYRKHMKSYQF